MSSPDDEARELMMISRRTAMTALSFVLLGSVVSGCGFQPLYGSAAVTGSAGIGDELAAIQIQEIPGRVGQVVRNELVFKTTGGGEAAQSIYRLEIALRESAQSTLVEIDGESKGVVFALNANFKLIRKDDNSVLMTGQAQSRAAYQKVESIFANIRARRDAEDRAAKMIADSIRTRVAAHLSQAA
jgi:LPS-assembly lipoprotein